MSIASDTPKIGLAANGNKVIIFNSNNSVGNVATINASNYNVVTNSWTNHIPISAAGSNTSTLAVHQNGNAICAWLGLTVPSGNAGIGVSMYNASTNTWLSPSIIISPDLESAGSDVQVSINVDGVGSVTWSSVGSDVNFPQTIWQATVALDGTFSAAQIYP